MNEKFMYENYLNDPNKIHEKYDITFSFEDYLDIINNQKDDNPENKKSDLAVENNFLLNQKRKRYISLNFNESIKKYKKNENAEFKDYDNPDIYKKILLNLNKPVISYDDL